MTNAGTRILYLTIGLLIGIFGGYFISLNQVQMHIKHLQIEREIERINERKGVECVMAAGALKCIVFTVAAEDKAS